MALRIRTTGRLSVSNNQVNKLIFYANSIRPKPTCQLYIMAHLDVSLIAEQHKFDLTIPTADQEPKKKCRMDRKSFAVACHTNMTRKTHFED